MRKTNFIKKEKTYNRQNSGFTLIELLVVVLVISALSGILLGVINSSGVRGKARDGQRKADLKKIQTALELYRADMRVYPASSVTNEWVLLAGSAAQTALVPNYIDPIPVDPDRDGSTDATPCANHANNRYNYKSDGTYYYLTAIMEVTTSKNDSPCPGIVAVCGAGAYDTQNHCYLVQDP